MKYLLCARHYVVTGWLTLEVSKKQNWGHLLATNGMSPVGDKVCRERCWRATKMVKVVLPNFISATDDNT